MTIIVEKRVTFDTERYAEDVINDLYELLEGGWQSEDWGCLTEEVKTVLVEKILTEAVRQVKEGE